MDRGRLQFMAGYSSWGHKDMTDQNTHTHSESFTLGSTTSVFHIVTAFLPYGRPSCLNSLSVFLLSSIEKGGQHMGETQPVFK